MSKFFRYNHETGQVDEVTHVNIKCNSRWPIYSESAGVHPDQIAEAKAFNKMHGLNVDYTPDGRPEFRDARHRERFLKAWRLYDKTGYNR